MIPADMLAETAAAVRAHRDLAELEATLGSIALTPHRSLNVWRKVVTKRRRQSVETRYEWLRRWDDPDREPYAFHRFDLERDEALELLAGTIPLRMQDAIDETRRRFGSAPGEDVAVPELTLVQMGLEPSLAGSSMQKVAGNKKSRTDTRR